MGKFTSKGLLFMTISGLLVGCSDVSATNELMEARVHYVFAEGTDERKLEKELPITVDVIDPFTKEVIRSFVPRELEIEEEDFLKELRDWAREMARGNGETKGYDQRMVLDKVGADGQIIKGKPQVILDEKALVERVIEGFENGGTVELPLMVKESQYALDEVSTLDEVVVAAYTTYFDSSVTGRAKNIELSAAAINNIILGVDDIFSFNEVVGPRTVETGYQKAMEIVNKELVEGIGGGICQTSSTLFNAIDQVGVNYIEWHHHSISIGYVPVGRDATVSYGGLDFRFQNKQDVPLLIKAYVNGGSITVEIRTSQENASKLNVNF